MSVVERSAARRDRVGKKYISYEEAARIFREEHRIVIPTAVLEKVAQRLSMVNGCVYEDARKKKKKHSLN